MSYRFILATRQWRASLRQSSNNSQLAAGLLLIGALAMIGYGFAATGQWYINELGPNLLSWVLTITTLIGLWLGYGLLSSNNQVLAVLPVRTQLLARLVPYSIVILLGGNVILLPYYLASGASASQGYLLALSLVLLLLAALLLANALGLAARRLSNQLIIRLSILLTFGLLGTAFLTADQPLIGILHTALVGLDLTELYYLLLLSAGAAGLGVASFELLSNNEAIKSSPLKHYLAVFNKTGLFRTSFHPIVATMLSELLFLLRARATWQRLLLLATVTLLFTALLRQVELLSLESWLLAVASLAATIFTGSQALSRSKILAEEKLTRQHLPSFASSAPVGRFLAGSLVSLSVSTVILGLATPELYRAEIALPLLLAQFGVYLIAYYFGSKLSSAHPAGVLHQLVLSLTLLALGLLPAMLAPTQSSTMVSWLSILWIMALLLLTRSFRVGPYRIG